MSVKETLKKSVQKLDSEWGDILALTLEAHNETIKDMKESFHGLEKVVTELTYSQKASIEEMSRLRLETKEELAAQAKSTDLKLEAMEKQNIVLTNGMNELRQVTQEMLSSHKEMMIRDDFMRKKTELLEKAQSATSEKLESLKDRTVLEYQNLTHLISTSDEKERATQEILKKIVAILITIGLAAGSFAFKVAVYGL